MSQSIESVAPRGKYPMPSTSSELSRLRFQHYAAKSAFGTLVLAPLDLSREGLQILDSATADGFFLYDLQSSLNYAGSARMIGSDISDFETDFVRPENIALVKQNIYDESPKEWRGRFDFVHQRLVLNTAKDFDTAAQVVKRLASLVKPGGWLQLVDGSLPTEPIQTNDLAHKKLYKIMSQILYTNGMNPTNGSRVYELIKACGDMEDVKSSVGIARMGKGAETKDMEENGYLWLTMFLDSVSEAMKGLPDPPMSMEEFDNLRVQAMEEAREGRVEQKFYAAWGRKKC